MEFFVLFTREECVSLPEDQSYVYYDEIKEKPYFIRIFKDTLEPVPIQNITGGLFVYRENGNGKIEIIPPSPKLIRY